MKVCVVRFAGSNCDFDTVHVFSEVLGHDTDVVFHKERFEKKYDIVVLPGGFSYGDHLRPGAIARFSPVMKDVISHAENGGLVIGICNGFQVLCEAGLLPGVLMRNKYMRFICDNVFLKHCGVFSDMKEIISLPIAHMDGNYYADESVIRELITENRIILKYSSESGDTDREYNPNGSSENIAGIMNSRGNIFGMMPHPERASEEETGGCDG
ncbi:MAG: phosphoribosylformylglycinamidine synthase subunit PurQ, partial [Candidatus Muiribacteriaceae bacterium]